MKILKYSVIDEYRISKKEAVYITAVFLKFAVQILTMSVVPNMIGESLCQKLFKLMTYSSYALVVCSVFMDFVYSKSEVIQISIIVLITLVGSYFSGNTIMLLMLYIYGAKRINTERVIRFVCGWSIGAFLIIAVGSKIGIIENWDFFTETSRPRWGLGFTYPTHTSSALFSAVLLFCYVQKDKLKIWHIAVIEAVNYWVYTYTDSRAGAYLILIIPVAFYLLRYIHTPIRTSSFRGVLEFVFPICAAAIIILTIRYNGTGLLQKLDQILSGRLRYSQYSLREYGVHLFGQRITWVGWGGIGHTQEKLSGEYNYVDSSYLQLLLTHGVLVWSMLMLLWTGSSFFAVLSNDRYLAWALAFLAVYCMVEQWLMNLGANPFLIILAKPLFNSSECRQIIRFREPQLS